jgi:hypothetical protein
MRHRRAARFHVVIDRPRLWCRRRPLLINAHMPAGSAAAHSESPPITRAKYGVS